MSLDSDDPRCPECGEPVSATSIYCMHCGADFENPGSSEDPSSSEHRTVGQAERTVETDSVTDSVADSVSDTPSQKGDDESESHLLDPDGLLDNSLTVLVGLVGGALIGFLALLFFGMLLESSVTVLPIGLAWLGSTGYLATRRTVGESIRYGCYATAILLVLLPFVMFTGAANGDLAGRIIFFVGAEVVLGLVALVLAGIGYLAGR